MQDFIHLWFSFSFPTFLSFHDQSGLLFQESYFFGAVFRSSEISVQGTQCDSTEIEMNKSKKM